MRGLLLAALLASAASAGPLEAPARPALPTLAAPLASVPELPAAAGSPNQLTVEPDTPVNNLTGEPDTLVKSLPDLFDGAPRLDREADVERLGAESFDVVVVGGGSVGAGTALDAASRGLKVALVEARDYASGTSSRSTKLAHGGVRYLEAAVKNLDRGQYGLVREALAERGNLLRNAPHLSRPLPIFTPAYRWRELPYYYVGLKLYDLLAGRRSTLPGARLLGRRAAERLFPRLNPAGLRGGVVYYDGQFDDARLNVALVQSARERGAAVANYVEATALKKEGGRIAGIVARDALTGKTFEVRGKAVINATGPGVDRLRRLDAPAAKAMLAASSGTHLVLPKRFTPPDVGLLIPKTSDGRVLFVLPWQGKTLVGTTDNPAEAAADPKPARADVDYILETMGRYYAQKPTRADVLSQWTGLRPLVVGDASRTTAQLSRDHAVEVADSGLISVAGGKWTTYRRIAEDVVDRALLPAGLQPPFARSRTKDLPVAGAEGYGPGLAQSLGREHGLEADVAAHLAETYGSRAPNVAKLAAARGARLAPGHPYIEAEVLYAVQVESARSVADVVERRLRLGFLDRRAELAALPRVAALMGEALGWDAARQARELEAARAQLAPAFAPDPPPREPIAPEKPKLTRAGAWGLALMLGSYFHYAVYPLIAWLDASVTVKLALAAVVAVVSWGLFLAGVWMGGASAWRWLKARLSR